MKKILLSSLLGIMLLIPTQAFADTVTPTATTGITAGVTTNDSSSTTTSPSTTTTVPSTSEINTATTNLPSAGITPDSPFYVLDTLLEKIQLAVTSDPVAKAALLDEDANERLSESNVMTDEKKPTYAQQALTAYQTTLSQASSQLDNAINKGEDVSNTVNSIAKLTTDTLAVAQKVINALPDGTTKQSLEQTVTDATTAIQATKDASDLLAGTATTQNVPLKQQLTQQMLENIIQDPTILAKVTQDGLNSREVLALKALSDQSGKSLSDVLSLFEQNKGLGATAKALGISPKDALKDINKTFQKNMKSVQREFKAEQQTEEQQLSVTNTNGTTSANPSSETKVTETTAPTTLSGTTAPSDTTKTTPQTEGQARAITHGQASFGLSHKSDKAKGSEDEDNQSETTPSTPPTVAPTQAQVPERDEIDTSDESSATNPNSSKVNKTIPSQNSEDDSEDRTSLQGSSERGISSQHEKSSHENSGHDGSSRGK